MVKNQLVWAILKITGCVKMRVWCQWALELTGLSPRWRKKQAGASRQRPPLARLRIGSLDSPGLKILVEEGVELLLLCTHSVVDRVRQRRNLAGPRVGAESWQR